MRTATTGTTVQRPIDEHARKQFESAWRESRPEPVEHFLPPEDHPSYPGTLEELVQIELEFLWKSWKPPAGQTGLSTRRPPLVEAYLSRFPRLNQPAALLRLLRQEGLLRHRYGDPPTPSEYRRRFPDLSIPDPEIEGWQAERTGTTHELPEIPGYEVLGVLNEGGMGVVYWAWQIALHRAVAIKMIQAGGHPGPEALARFRTETTAVARLQHPNVVQIYEMGEQAGRPYFSMEFMDGGSLAQKCTGMPQPAQAAVRLVETLARAVHYAHQHGIIHRDLKPGNVLLTAAGVPKITDFGLAKLLVGAVADQTQSGTILGTPSYMAPEQAGGPVREVGPATDVYALGVILYEMLTGRPPFRAETPLDTIRQVVSDEPLPPTQLQPKVPRDLETICLKCLHKQPRKRYPSAEALADDLRRFSGGESILARPTGRVERGLKWAKRRPALAALLGVSTLAAAALLVLGLFYQVQLQRQRDRAVSLQQAAEEAEQVAREQELTARRYMYAAHLELAQRAWDKAHVALVLALLEEQRPRPGQKDLRGFEWYYLQRLCHQERLTITGADNPVFSVAFAPDGQTLATGGGVSDRPGEVRLWDAVTGRERSRLRGHTREVREVKFSPDAKTLATASEDGTVKLWDVSSARARLTLTGHRGPVRSVAYAPDGKTLATGSWDRTAKLWDAATGKELLTFTGHRGGVLSVAWAPDGKTLATAGTDHSVRLWDVTTGQARRTLEGHREPVPAVAFSPGGKLLATGSADRTVRLWDTATGREAATLRGHTDSVTSVAFGPDGRTLVSGSYDGTVKLWDPLRGRLRATFKGHTHWIWCVAYSPDGKLLASAGEDKTVKLWEPARREEPATLEGHTDEVSAAVFAPDGKTLLTASRDGTARVWDVATGQESHTLRGHGAWVTGAAFAAGGKDLVTSGMDRAVKLWAPATGQERATLTGHTAAIRCLAVSPDGRTLATGSGYWDRSGVETRLWDLPTRRKTATLTGQRSAIRAVAFAPDGRTLATGSFDRTMKLWDLATGKVRATLAGHDGPILAVAFAPDGRTLATASADRTVKLWLAATGTLQRTLRGHTGPVNSVAFHPDGRILASASDDLTVKLWDLATGRQRLTLHGHTGEVRAVAYAPDGRTLASGSTDKTVKLWSLDSAPEAGGRLGNR